MSLAEAEWDIRIAEPEQPDNPDVPRLQLQPRPDLVPHPMFLFRGPSRSGFLEKIPWEVETNINRLAAQWEDRINAAIDGMHRQAVQYVRDETATIESLLSSAGDGRTRSGG